MIKPILPIAELLRPIFLFFVSALALLSGFRFLHFSLYSNRVSEAIGLGEFFILGLRADLMQVSYFIVIPLLVLPFLIPFMNRYRAQSLWYRVSLLWFTLCFIILWFMEISTPAFLAQYDTRPNRLFFEYLEYPAEVFSTLWNGFKTWLMIGAASTLLTIYILKRIARIIAQRFQPEPMRRRYLLGVYSLLLVMVVLGIRSTLAHRPANPAFFAVTSDAMVNSLILNSTYTLEYALYNLKHESKANLIYGDMKTDEVLTTVKQNTHLKEYEFPYKDYPTVHFQPATRKREKPLNIVIILEESLGATFVESLGGVPVTPNLERLKSDGWWFERLYATGTRSVRGIEAVVSGFLPTRARSTVKLSNSQRQFFTLADVLSRQGYFTEFIYGGQAHFDNMANFFVGNGFQSIIDQDDYKTPNFTGSWGVSDEDLFNKLHQRLVVNTAKHPTFTLAFSSSNHEPFKFPDNTIKLHEEPKNTVNNAVKYADYALGEFFRKARQSNYWDNTLFLVVADHDTRVYGDDLIPVNKFHIPGLILGADLEPRTIKSTASQIDLAPTLLSLAGVSAYLPTVGQDLSRTDKAPGNRAMMQFGDNYGWLEGDTLTVLRVNKPTEHYRYIPEVDKQESIEDPLSPEQLKKIRAFAMLPSILYQSREYYVPKD
ncbi:UNVERIFIED_ORG: phosphoglycerol transferase MdoB-like AlkP superfamily enzyme [Idiomarina abyssalis]|uniref:LTA synthase family protein n=1 Tax=Idiomarina sp. 017G TaxID=2183988 RepID=UPI000E0E95C5|nr:LTA synthase family protein [Idiomarina sp. 017G]TDO51025.1 phosphoglycerol transferase MdoB-like AlkP superfamily enzyme [Idiomarina sp. 017G]